MAVEFEQVLLRGTMMTESGGINISIRMLGKDLIGDRWTRQAGKDG